MSDDRAVVRQAKAGDLAAWQRLVSHHGPRVYALCRRLDVDPDDAYQACWEKIYTALDGFDSTQSTPFGAWVHTLTRRLLIDRHRRRQRRSVLNMRTTPPPSVPPAAEDVVLSRERSALLESSLQKLPALQRRVIILHHIEGLSLEDIAAHEQTAIGTIKSRLHRGRARLARTLGASS